MTKHVLSHPAAAGDGADCDINGVEGPESWWRIPCTNHLVGQMARPLAERHLTQLVGRVRPFAVEVAHDLDSTDTAAMIGALLGSVKSNQRPIQALAFDLLVSALLIEALRGDPTAKAVVDHFRRRRGLSQIDWRAAQISMLAAKAFDRDRALLDKRTECYAGRHPAPTSSLP